MRCPFTLSSPDDACITNNKCAVTVTVADHLSLESHSFFRRSPAARDNFITVAFRTLGGNHVVSTTVETKTRVKMCVVRVWHVVWCVRCGACRVLCAALVRLRGVCTACRDVCGAACCGVLWSATVSHYFDRFSKR